MNIVSRTDDLAAYGDGEFDKSRRYDRTLEFLRIVRRLWHEEDVTFHGEFYRLENSTAQPRPFAAGLPTPRLYFGGASPAAEEVAAAEADVQLFWVNRSTGSPNGSTGCGHCPTGWAASTHHSNSACGSPPWYGRRRNRRGGTPRPSSPHSPPHRANCTAATPEAQWDSAACSS